jgi:hypothetical protein
MPDDVPVGRGSGVTVRIAMWSGPRNLSTALMRSFGSRPDTVVMDEPLYAHYLARTGLDHPGRDEIIARGPTGEREAVARCLAPVDAELSYQKHMAHHLLPGMDRRWLDGIDHHFLLLRHPARVLASYARKRDGEVTVSDLGLPQQVELVERLGDPLIIDSDDFLRDPAAHLQAICRRAGIGFDPCMLAWPSGPRDTDGVWAPHWYDAVWASTGFSPVRFEGLPPVAAGMQAVLDEAQDLYEVLAGRRLRLT